MGIKESIPILRGKTVSLNTQEEENYFNRNHLILRNYFVRNSYSDYNLLKSLETKSFVNGNKKPDRKDIKDYTWVEYLIIQINKLKEKYHAPWTNSLLYVLKDKNLIILENKFFSDFFYHDYEIKTMPKIINSQNEKIDNSYNNDYVDLFKPLGSTELTVINDNNYCELDVLDNLGGSYLEINYDELLPEDPAYQYQQIRNDVKKYIKIFKEHIYTNSDHPINQIICIFNKLFSEYINEKLKEYNDQLEKRIINQEKFDNLIQNFEKEITNSLQEFISQMHSALKLFYSTSIDLKFFEEEKDDLINMITCFFFRTGKLYESILNLYSITFKQELQNFQEKLIELKPVKPKKLGIEIKFCLDEDTIDLQNKLKNSKNIKNFKEEKKEIKEDNSDLKKVKKSSLFQNIAKENKSNNLFTIKEREDEKDESINIIEDSKNSKNTGGLLYYLDDDKDNKNEDIHRLDLDYHIPIRSKTRLPKIVKEDDYILERLSFLEDSRNDNYHNVSNQIRNSVNNFNNKIYFFPKLHKKLKNNININEEKKTSKFYKNKDSKEIKLPLPYISAINLMKSIKKYKTPFEKILLVAAISDQIMESATSFWKDMEQYIEKDYLFIEADEIMTIFLYIIIQSQMPDILLYCKIINNFTTQFTKGFNIAYNYTLLEASVDYINDLKDINDLSKNQNGFNDASKAILNISNQRISRLSLGMGQG